MGVAGCGKSTTGERLGSALGWPFRDADSFHPPCNIDKMRCGVPLTDEDRWPWLDAIRAWIDAREAAAEPGIVSCSALRRVYRERLLQGHPNVGLVYLKGDFELIAGRMSRRRHHFMPVSLLESQFRALEEPGRSERALVVPVTLPPKKVVERILRGFGLPRRSA
jgi:carbohydrate kinase (thermoresistant glucokinase family)